MSDSDGASIRRELWARNVAAVKANLVPGLVLQGLALIIVFAYYFWEPAAGAFASVAALKQRYGYVYSGLATALFGGVIPYLFLLVTKQVPAGQLRNYALFYVFFWLWRGVEVDALYRLQDHLFGSVVHWKVILTKVLADQFIYCPIWASPITAIFYTWRDEGFSWSAFRARFNRDMFVLEMPSFLLATWIVWIPAVAIIYALPLPLQVPLFNIVLCFFVLMVSFLSKRTT
ncbi:MAG: hypothetical protein ACI957_002878 [Verrucomicrobiales bacterium]|jgi:hypothetical protein